MTICRKCGTSNQDGKKFCTFCHELLIADPVEMAKREAAEQKKQQKLQKKLDKKHLRHKNALLLLIPIGVLDLIDLVLCLDLALVGVGTKLSELLYDLLYSMDVVGQTLRLFGNLVYTDQVLEYIIRGCELLVAAGLLAVSTALVVVMIVRMVKWRRYRMYGDKQEQAAQLALQNKQGMAQGVKTEVVSAQENAHEAIEAIAGEQNVSYASLVELAAGKDAYAMLAPMQEVTCRGLYQALVPHLWEYDEDSVRRILSAMSASRMLLCSAGAMDSASIFDNLTRALAVRAEQYTCPELAEHESADLARVLLQHDEQTGTVTHTSFVKALYTAGFSPANVCLAGVGGVRAQDIDAVFSPLSSYFRYPAGNVGLFIGTPDEQSVALPAGIDEGMLTLSPNLWMLGVLPETDTAPAVGAAVGEYCATVYLRNSGKAFPPESAETAQAVTVSPDALERAVAAAEEEYYLPEEMWQVIDGIEQQVLEMGGVRLSNRTLRTFERYTSVYMACGGKELDAFDNGFAAVIVPAYADQLKLLAKREQGESPADLLERTVGREHLPVTVQVLTAMEMM